MAAAPNRVGRLYDLQREGDGKGPKPYVWTAKVKIPPPTRRQVREMRLAETGEQSNKAIFGEYYDEITAYYDDRPVHEWDDFIDDVNKQFFGPGVGDEEGKSPSENSSD